MPDSVAYAIIGGLREDYVINSAGEVHLRILGGNAVYAAAGARVWNKNVGVVSRVGSNFPAEWLARLEKAGIDVRAVRVLPDPQDTRTFYAYLSQEERVDTDPIAHFARVGRPVPRELVDYESSTTGQESRTQFMPLAVRPADLSEAVLGSRGYHLAPADFLTHHTVPVALRRNSRPIVTVDPSIRYMQPAFKDDLRRIVSGIDAFLPSEMEIHSFFRDEKPGLWEAAAALGAMGAAFIDIKLGSRGQYLYESSTGRKWHIPAYPATVRDVTGAGDAYCGGFLVGLAETGDAVEAALRGSISASIVVEGQGALYALDTTPGLAEARLQSLREGVRKV
jgi:sugar/nucleoside kinase (ribokinase family)